MKPFIFAVNALLALASFSTAARALSSNSAVLAKVPFNFTVGYDQLPSGTYTISGDPWGIVKIQSIDRLVNVSVATTVEPQSMSGDKLVFRRYGDRYFLSKVSTSVLSVHVPVSKLEKAARSQETKAIGEHSRSPEGK
jgi:hypothetical protein